MVSDKKTRSTVISFDRFYPPFVALRSFHTKRVHHLFSSDALLTEERACSFPELSQSPYFERRWPSLYEAFEDGRIDEERLRQVFVAHLPPLREGQNRWIGIDVSVIARPRARTSADRSSVLVHNLPKGEKVTTFGWQFSTVVALPESPSSWTYALAAQRVSTEATAAQVAFEQLQQLAPVLPTTTTTVLDRGYDSTWLWCQCSTLPFKGTLIRLKGNRCFYRVAPAPTRTRGRPHKDGARLQPKDQSTHGHPGGQVVSQDPSGRPVLVTWWRHLHVKTARWLDLTVIQIVRPHATNTGRDPRQSWFVWIGDPEADLGQIALGYVRRFSQEHGYRFDKQALLWEKSRLRTPAQFERWTHLVAIARNYLVLARDLVQAELRPWESVHRPPTPQQVRRGINKLLPQLGTPARPPQPRGKSPGRAKGTEVRKARRFAVVKKRPKLPKLIPI
ncbi:MAG: transposase [Ktedonobacteraceae bacterium]|nr:transposase [Ktedonobacteraceae bacterium]